MSHRARWLGVGLVAGFGASKWVERKIRRRLSRYLPANGFPAMVGTELAVRAREAASSTARELREAVTEARAGMEEREAELRSQLGLGRPVARPPWPRGSG
jgi:hypothetical protein